MTGLLLVLVVLVNDWASYANRVSTSHDPATWSGHDDAPLLATQFGEHDHSHDESQSDDDRSAGHQHGHHTADHSHDTSNLPDSETHTVVMLSEAWVVASPIVAYPAPCFCLERPPKSLSIC